MTEIRESSVPSQLRIRLLLNHEIDKRLDQIVRASGRRVSLLHNDRAMRENQIRNVLDVAISTQSLDVVTNFIRYQMGRSGGNQAWLHNDFGQKVVEDLESRQAVVHRIAEEVTDKVCREVEDADRDQIVRESRLRLMQLYLGYLNRWFYYGSKTRRFDDIKQATQEENDV